MAKVLIRLMLAVGVIVFMTSAAHSELIVYEPFDYPVSDLVGNSGAFGIGPDGWEDWEQTEPAQVVEGSLLHPVYGYELDFIGNHAEVISGQVVAFFLTSLPDDGRDYWISFLYQTVDSDSYGHFYFLFPDAAETPALGLEINGGGPAFFSIYDDWAPMGGVEDPSAVLWIVIKAETSGSQSTSEMGYLWVDPVPWAEPDIAEANGDLEYLIKKGDVMNSFRMWGSGDPAAYKIDEIKVGTSFEDVSVIPRCEKASNPTPENGEPYADAGLTELDWDAPTCVEDPTYNVYFNPDVNFVTPIAADITETTCTLPGSLIPLDYETIYYWRVDVIDPNDGVPVIHEGRVWHFTTWAQNPTVTTQPASTTVAVGAEAGFSVEAVNTESYQWYYRETLDGEEELISGATNPTYTIDVVLEDHEGYYYCRATNFDGSTDSDRARLLTERLMAHWNFEDNLEDEVDPLNDGTATGYIFFDEGVGDGNSVAIVDANFITTTNSLGQLTEITVSMWFNPDALVEEEEQTLLAANGTWDPGTVYIYTVEDQIYGLVIEDQEEEISVIVGPAEIAEGVWNHCVFVYDTSTEFSALYLNGELIDEDDDTPVPPILPPLSIGAVSAEEGLPYSGLIDDLRIYDYRLSDLQIASMYTEIMTEANVCIGRPDYDLSENCHVDLVDLELLVTQWLECNIVPTCVQ